MGNTMGSKIPVDNPRGLPIVEATEDLMVTVTKEDIVGASPLDPNHCAFARACQRMGAKRATVLRTRTYLEFEDRIERFITPESAARELISLDRGGSFAAGTFTFKAPTKSDKLVRNGGTRRQGKRKSTRNAGSGRMPPHVTIMVRTAST